MCRCTVKLWAHIVQWSTESSRCTLHPVLKESCSSWSEPQLLLFLPPAEHQSLSQRTGGQCSGGAAWLVGTERRLIKSDPLVQCSLITFSPTICHNSLWRGGSNLRPVTWSWSTWVTLLMSERPGGSSHCWAGKYKSCWQADAISWFTLHFLSCTSSCSSLTVFMLPWSQKVRHGILYLNSSVKRQRTVFLTKLHFNVVVADRGGFFDVWVFS